MLHEYKALTKFIKQNPCFCINQNKLFCNVCDVERRYSPGEGTRDLERHLRSLSHKSSTERKTIQTRLQLERHFDSNKDSFHSEILELFVKMNIPIYKLQDENLKTFISKYTGKKLLDESMYRKAFLEKVFTKKQNEVRDLLKNENIYLMFDETTDASGRYILNILSGICSPSQRERSYLIKTVELDKTNALNVNTEILEVLNWIYNSDVSKFSNVKLLVSDGAPYAVKAAKLLKELMPKVLHVVCLCHNLHNLCESIRSDSPNLNLFVAFMKKVLIKNYSNRNRFAEITNLSIPKFPIITRWGTWIDFSVWIFNNLESIKKFIHESDFEQQNQDNMLEIIESDTFEREITLVKEHSFLTNAITTLENGNLSTIDQISKLKYVLEKINNQKKYSDRLGNILLKNPDLNYFMNFNEMKITEQEKCFSYVPLTSVDVERSFSKFKHIFSDQRRSMKIENLEMYLTLNFNEN